MSFVAEVLVKLYFTAAHCTKIHKKFIRRKVRSSFKIMYFYIDEPKFLRNIQIFKKISAMYMGKYIF